MLWFYLTPKDLIVLMLTQHPTLALEQPTHRVWQSYSVISSIITQMSLMLGLASSLFDVDQFSPKKRKDGILLGCREITCCLLLKIPLRQHTTLAGWWIRRDCTLLCLNYVVLAFCSVMKAALYLFVKKEEWFEITQKKYGRLTNTASLFIFLLLLGGVWKNILPVIIMHKILIDPNDLNKHYVKVLWPYRKFFRVFRSKGQYSFSLTNKIRDPKHAQTSTPGGENTNNNFATEQNVGVKKGGEHCRNKTKIAFYCHFRKLKSRSIAWFGRRSEIVNSLFVPSVWNPPWPSHSLLSGLGREGLVCGVGIAWWVSLPPVKTIFFFLKTKIQKKEIGECGTLLLFKNSLLSTTQDNMTGTTGRKLKLNIDYSLPFALFVLHFFFFFFVHTTITKARLHHFLHL